MPLGGQDSTAIVMALLMAAAGVFITVPAFLAALSIQKHFEAGLTGGAVK